MPRVRITFEKGDEDLELFEQAARALAERARRDAEGCKGNSIEQIHRRSEARFLRFADRIKAVRSRPDPEPSKSNLRPIKPRG